MFFESINSDLPLSAELRYSLRICTPMQNDVEKENLMALMHIFNNQRRFFFQRIDLVNSIVLNDLPNEFWCAPSVLHATHLNINLRIHYGTDRTDSLEMFNGLFKWLSHSSPSSDNLTNETNGAAEKTLAINFYRINAREAASRLLEEVPNDGIRNEFVLFLIGVSSDLFFKQSLLKHLKKAIFFLKNSNNPK